MPFIKNRSATSIGQQQLQFKVSQELFSSLDVDHGTQRLLRSLLFENILSYGKVLDLGCGYGPIGLSLKKSCPSAEIHLVDIDALALEFAKENARLNGIKENKKDINIYASLGYDQVTDNDFDLIACNIPAKIGDQAIQHILKDARHYLTDRGKVAVVVIDSIADFVHDQLSGDENIAITYHRRWPGHHVYHYQFVGRYMNSKSSHPSTLLAFEQGLFFKNQTEFANSLGKYTFDVSFNLPEFDQLDFQTKQLQWALRNLSGPVSTAYCFSAGQGHLPFFISQNFQFNSISVSDRNLLALKTTQHNLAKYQITVNTDHSVFPASENQFDLLTGALPAKQNPPVYEQLLSALQQLLRPGGKVVVVTTSTTLSRLENSIKAKFSILKREKARGNAVLILRNK